jgi:hypothetical protein
MFSFCAVPKQRSAQSSERRIAIAMREPSTREDPPGTAKTQVMAVKLLFAFAAVIGVLAATSSLWMPKKLQIGLSLLGWRGLLNVTRENVGTRVLGLKATESREAWHRLVDTLSDFDTKYLLPDRGTATEDALAEGHMYGLHLLTTAVELFAHDDHLHPGASKRDQVVYMQVCECLDGLERLQVHLPAATWKVCLCEHAFSLLSPLSRSQWASRVPAGSVPAPQVVGRQPRRDLSAQPRALKLLVPRPRCVQMCAAPCLASLAAHRADAGRLTSEVYYSLSLYATPLPGQYAAASIGNLNSNDLVADGEGYFEVRACMCVCGVVWCVCVCVCVHVRLVL